MLTRSVKNYEEVYQVTSNGDVISLHGSTPHLMKLRRDKDGYKIVTLHLEGKTTVVRVHRLVLEAFAGSCPEGYESAHLNGSNIDNRISNLMWVTHAENMAHKIGHRTNNSRAKLAPYQVVEIRQQAESGKQLSQLAKEYGIKSSQVSKIVKRKRWKWVE